MMSIWTVPLTIVSAALLVAGVWIALGPAVALAAGVILSLFSSRAIFG